MTDLTKPVTRRAVRPHPNFDNRRVVAALIPGDVLTLRLERERGEPLHLSLNDLYEQAHWRRARANANL